MVDFTNMSELPASSAAAITPTDDTDLGSITRGLYVGVSGDVTVVMRDGQTVLFTALAAGVVHPLAVRQVHDTGTDATNIVGVW